MTATIDALYIFDEQRQCVLDHIYNGRPPKPSELRASYASHPAPQPSVLYLSDLNPATTAYSIRHATLLLIATSSVEVPALAILEFLRKVVDIFEDFLGSPLLSSKIEDNYETIAQLLAEMCDGGTICNTEPNALRENVEISSALGKLFNQISISNPTSSLTGPAALKPATTSSNQPSIPWRRSNVRHTSNELYVDIVETLHVISAPSGRPISAQANGSIVFTAKVSGIPEIVLSLSAPGGTSQATNSGISKTMALPSFHPCVRLNRWKEKPGELSFVPPDGKFMLAGYSVDLLPFSFKDESSTGRGSQSKIFLPASVDLQTGLGASGLDFEAKVTLDTNFPGSSSFPGRPGGPDRNPSTHTPFTFPGVGQQAGTTGAPTIEAVSVTIPFGLEVRNVLDFRPSRGDATFNQQTKIVEWKIPTNSKDGTVSGTATLKGTITGPMVEADELEFDPTMEEYYSQSSTTVEKLPKPQTSKKQLLPRVINASFVVKGWLPSGIKVDALMIDTRKSKGISEGVKPYKGVKYLCVSKNGVERRSIPS